MKVVLFCGGFGMRIREYSEQVPKPMVPIGNRPILWHVMKYYAHFGHKDFILCLGHNANAVKQYFLHYDECISNDFTITNGGRDIALERRDIDDWTIKFVDTGLHSNIGERLLAVREHLAGEELFLANYSDGLTDLPLDQLIDSARQSCDVATFLCVRPHFTAHFIEASPDGNVQEILAAQRANLWINVGFFVFRNSIFEYIEPGEELVLEPFNRLIAEKQLKAHRYQGFFQAMDTFKEREQLEEMIESTGGRAPWMVWQPSAAKGTPKVPRPNGQTKHAPARIR